jgi:hypothetical protein
MFGRSPSSTKYVTFDEAGEGWDGRATRRSHKNDALYCRPEGSTLRICKEMPSTMQYHSSASPALVSLRCSTCAREAPLEDVPV